MIEPRQIWWTTSELALAVRDGLPGLPRSRQGIEKIARDQWRCQAEFARKREGRGGGWEYNWRLLPLLTRKRLLAEAGAIEVTTAPRNRDEVWTWFEGLPQRVRDKAEARLRVLQAVEALAGTGLTRRLAVIETACTGGVSQRTIFNWLAMVEGVDPADWLAYLAPRNTGSGAKATGDVDDRFFDTLKADYLRLEAPSFASAFRRTSRIARSKRWPIPGERMARRHMEANVPRVVQVFAREGATGLEKCFPPQIRDRSQMTALEGVNADCHKIDVFVSWPGRETPVRPQIIAFQDIYSGKILSWRVDWSPNKVAVMAAFGDVVEKYGIPQHCLVDNGREFANKWLTGGAKTRFRFKIREGEPLGVLPLLGVQIHWARPARGQSKPIERAFRDMADEIAKDPRFHGAYVGHKPDAKPENYGERAVDLETFLRVVEDGIAEHNARQGRLSHTAHGRSFDETFAESYAKARISMATEEQRRLWLMGQQEIKLHATHGRATVHKNVYWSDWMNEYAGKAVVARFDPEKLHDGAYIYAKDGRYLGFAACEQAVGFFDMASAREAASREARERKAHKDYLKKLRPTDTADLGKMLDETPRETPEALEAKVIRPAFGTRPGQGVKRPAPPATPDRPEVEARQAALIKEFSAPQGRTETTDTAEDAKQARFRRALRVEADLDRGAPVGDAELDWWKGYKESPEYAALRRLHNTFGDGMFAG